MGAYGRKGRTHKDFVRDVAAVQPHTRVVGRYVDFTTPVRMECKRHRTTWDALPKNVLHNGRGTCPVCGEEKRLESRRLSAEEAYDKRLANKPSGIVRLEPYVDRYTPIKFRCKLGHEFTCMPVSAARGSKSGCFQCGKIAAGHTQRTDLEEIIAKLKACDIAYVSGYAGISRKCELRCDKCATEWKASPHNAARGFAPCPTCAAYRKSIGHWKTRKEYRLGKRTVVVAGYEPFALDVLQKKFKPSEIKVQSDGLPIIRYKDIHTHRRHLPDIYVESANLLVEVKSAYTSGLTGRGRSMFANLQRKAKAARKEGFKYRVMMFTPEGKRLRLPKGWESLATSTVRRRVREINGLVRL